MASLPGTVGTHTQLAVAVMLKGVEPLSVTGTLVQLRMGPASLEKVTVPPAGVPMKLW
jgi:hypothetical protein